MRRWMRDRSKRRKQQPGKQGTEQPAPLQPKFPEPIPDDIGNRVEQPEYEAPAAAYAEPDLQESQPTAKTGGGEEPPQGPRRDRDRNRRRGRRGRGGRPQAPSQAPAMPTPGGPTGEASEADTAPELTDAAAAARPPAPHESKKTKGAVVLAIGLPGSGKSTWF